MHVGGDVAVVRCAEVAEDASAHAAVVFAVPEGEGCVAGVAGVGVLVVNPRVWQTRWDVHMLETVRKVIVGGEPFRCTCCVSRCVGWVCT